MKINGEPVEAVRELADLRPGVTIYYVPCSFCGAPHHRMMVTKHIDVLSGMLPTGEEGEKSGGWVCAPGPVCVAPLDFVVTARSVEKRMIFWVVDPARAADITSIFKPVMAGRE